MGSVLRGRAVLPGQASGEVLYSDVPLSFMGGIDPQSGVVIDKHHPLIGARVARKVLALPSGRGSCSGSGVLLELLANGNAPAALVFRHPEPILALGVIIGAELFGLGLPVVELGVDDFTALSTMTRVRVEDAVVDEGETVPSGGSYQLPELDLSAFELSERDEHLLSGAFGEAARVASRIVVRAAQLEGATELIDVDMAHIDGCFFQGPASLQLAQRLRDLGGRVRVPTTMNALRVDRRRWREQGVPVPLGESSEALADAYVAMGVQPTYTCAPYLLSAVPAFGQQVAWAESNAVMFANAVLGARTMKYPDYLDIMVALTGRAPNAGCHVPAHRRATVRAEVSLPRDADDSFYPVLGYLLGLRCPHEIPVVIGLESSGMTVDDLRAFGAAFATTSAAPMFHIVGVTPEATTLEQVVVPTGSERSVVVGRDDLAQTWLELNTATAVETDLIALGNPHLSLSEFALLADLCGGRIKSPDVEMIITCGRETFGQAAAAGFVERLTVFGAHVINDTCWCLVDETLLASSSLAITTNSAKYAHYGPSTTARGFHLRSLSASVDAACAGRVAAGLPRWL